VTGARSAQRQNQHRGPPGASLPVRVLLAAMMLAAFHVEITSAQRSRPTIIVAAPLRIEPAVRVALLIQIAPLDAVPRGGFVRLRGLPATAALSDGHSIGPGAWAIPVAALPELKILVPESATTQSEIHIALVATDGTVLAEARSTLIVAAGAAPIGAPPQQPPGEAKPFPRLSPEAHERALRLVKKGNEQLAEGGIAQARLLYERAADAGLALGAMAMAATYDAVELQRLGVRGLKPDGELARKWYERARQLGAIEAEERLRRLGAK
jgi:hypothetical protein